MTEVPQPETPVITPAPESRLEQLTAEYERLKPLAAKYRDELEACKDAIKLEMITAQPEATRMTLSSPYLPKPLWLTQTSSWKFDSKTLKKEQPELYVRYAYQSTSWRLEAEK